MHGLRHAPGSNHVCVSFLGVFAFSFVIFVGALAFLFVIRKMEFCSQATGHHSFVRFFLLFRPIPADYIRVLPLVSSFPFSQTLTGLGREG